MNVILTVNVLDLITNVNLEVANMKTQTNMIGIKILDQPEEQIQIPEVALGPEAMLPSNFRQ